MSRESRIFAKKMSKLRKAGGMTQLELALKTGLDLTTINELENGHREPLLATLRKVARAMRVSIDTLTS